MLLNQKDHLKSEVLNLKCSIQELEKRPAIDTNIKLENRINELINQKNSLLKENLELKDKKLFAIEIHSSDKKTFNLKVPSTMGGNHTYTKEEDFSEDQIRMLTQLSHEIDQESDDKDQDKLTSIFDKKINSLVDPKMNNRDYRKCRPSYRFSS
jgi:hypothetical protein